MRCKCGGRCLSAAASLVLTAALIATGISFFAPYWLNNVNSQNATDSTQPYVTQNGTSIVQQLPYRGLWAQCGQLCTWFWQNGYELQTKKFTPLSTYMYVRYLTAHLIAQKFTASCESRPWREDFGNKKLVTSITFAF